MDLCPNRPIRKVANLTFASYKHNYILISVGFVLFKLHNSLWRPFVASRLLYNNLVPKILRRIWHANWGMHCPGHCYCHWHANSLDGVCKLRVIPQGESSLFSNYLFRK